MDYVKTTELIATVLCIIGVTYGSIPRRIGIWYLIVGTIFWFIFALLTEYWFLLSQQAFFLIINIICLKTWKKQGIRF